MSVILLDNQDSFVYNLANEFANLGIDYRVMRNTVPADDLFAAAPDLICLSPGPGHPRAAGIMMEVIERAWGRIPLFGICLGFQAILEYTGGHVGPVGAVHGQAHRLTLTEAGRADPLFSDLGPDGTTSVARYHSLGCVQTPPALECLARIGDVVMAARAREVPALGLQFHPESILSERGPQLIVSAIESLLDAHPAGVLATGKEDA